MTQRELILSRMEASVRDYVSERPNADYHTITAHFGTPKQIVISCLEEMDGEELVNELSVKKKVVGIVYTAAVIAVLLWAGAVFSALEEHEEHKNGFYKEKIVNVHEITNSVEGE